MMPVVEGIFLSPARKQWHIYALAEVVHLGRALRLRSEGEFIRYSCLAFAQALTSRWSRSSSRTSPRVRLMSMGVTSCFSE